MRVITVAHYALVPFSNFSNTLNISTQSENIQWFSFESLPNKLTFDHANILYDLLERLRGKISYTPIVFNLLEKHFTWTELQEIYEIVLGIKLIAPNFRRKLLFMYNIKELNEKKRTKGRPSSLLEFEGEKEF